MNPSDFIKPEALEAVISKPEQDAIIQELSANNSRKLEPSDTVYLLSRRYDLSADYQLLARLARQESIVCVVDYRGQADCKDVAHTLWFPERHGPAGSTGYSPELFQVSARGYGYIYAYGEEEFINQCKTAGLGFLIPNTPEVMNKSRK